MKITDFVKSEHLTGHLPAIIESYSHAVVDLSSVLWSARYIDMSDGGLCTYKVLLKTTLAMHINKSPIVLETRS